MRKNSWHFLGLIALAAAALQGQTTPVYWSTTIPDCSSLSNPVVEITNSSGTVIGYSCSVSGTFVWLATGGGWTSKIRVGAPATAAIGVDYTFYDPNGNNLSLDSTFGGGAITSSNEVSFALSANQPSEVDLLGATSNAPAYGPTTTGTAYAVFYCPDAVTCTNVLPQLIYLQQPTHPWLATVPIAWDDATWTQWSAEGVDDGTSNNVVSFVVYNQGTTATSFNVDVFDGTGTLVASGTTPLIPPLPLLSGGFYGEGGTYGADLRTPGLITSGTVPTGVIKILIDGGTVDSSVQMFQITGPSLASMQVANDAAPGSTGIIASAVRRAHAKSVRGVPAQKRVFGALPHSNAP